MRTGKELLIASARYAQEDRRRSWRELLVTLALLVTFITLACLNLPWVVCIASSLLAGLMSVRMFIIYHDYQHGAILRDSRLGAVMMHVFGLLILSPPMVWKHSHNDHHKNNAKKFGATLGTFPLMSIGDYAEASWWERLNYNVARHPLTIALGYITVFFWEMCLHNFWQNPRKQYDGAIAALLHVGLIVVLALVSVQSLLLGLLLPMTVASGLGAYLFYAQHNFPGMERRHGPEWDLVYAALRSSSFMKMNPVMHWLTGNIGYHHVHHLNAKIPFYRLPEAMAGIKELQTPKCTSLHPADIARCLRLKLWDPTRDRLVGYREAVKGSAGVAA